MNKINIGIIGFGNMGQAIANQLKALYTFYAFDKDAEKFKNLVNINAAADAKELAGKVEVIILAVKPQDFDSVLGEIKNCVEGKLVVSIAAGITTGYLEKWLTNARVVRVMPNLAAKIGLGVAGISKGKFAVTKDLNFVKKLFAALGKAFIVEETMINALTAVSGSVPGFFYEFINGKYVLGDEISLKIKKEFTDSLNKAALDIGFDAKTAKALVKGTVLGSIALLKESNLAPAQLRDKVASKGGTTEAGIKVLQAGGSVVDAVKAAKQRADELARIAMLNEFKS